MQVSFDWRRCHVPTTSPNTSSNKSVNKRRMEGLICQSLRILIFFSSPSTPSSSYLLSSPLYLLPPQATPCPTSLSHPHLALELPIAAAMPSAYMLSAQEDLVKDLWREGEESGIKRSLRREGKGLRKVRDWESRDVEKNMGVVEFFLAHLSWFCDEIANLAPSPANCQKWHREWNACGMCRL